METRQANPTPPPGMKGGVEEGGRAGKEVGLIETQIPVDNEPRSFARVPTAGTPPPVYGQKYMALPHCGAAAG